MIRFGNHKDAYTFSDKTHPKEGFVSVGVGCVGLIGYFILFLITSRSPGGLGIGSIGLTIFFIALVGIWLAIKAMKKEDALYRFPILGVVINGILVLLSVSLYFFGLASNIAI